MKSSSPGQRRPFPPVAALFFGSLLLTTSCASEVAFYEKAAFADPVMDLADEPLETHWYAKVIFSMEGSIGGIGNGGGGGCGCY